MDCCQCQGFEKTFDRKTAARDLKRYRKKGPNKTTVTLIEALKEQGIHGLSLLDVGGGVGAIQHELLKAGVTTAVGIDASLAYIEAVKEEALRQGHQDRVSYQFGNFVDLAKDLNPADIVTLDKVICCYHDAVSLVGMSGNLASRYYGIVYPRDTWWIKLGWKLTSTLIGLVMRITRNPFRGYLHASSEVTAILTDMGFQLRFHSTRGLWQIVVYARQKPMTQQ